MSNRTSLVVGVSLVAALAVSACAQQPSEPSTATDPVRPTTTQGVDTAVPVTDAPRRGWRWQTRAESPAHAGWSFDPAAVDTVEGEVREVVLTEPRGPGGGGVHLIVGTADGPVTVALGPAWYVERQEPAIEVGDAVEVVGARVDETFVVAAEVERGGEKLVLRSDDGAPMWRGWRRGRGSGRR